MKNKKKNSKYIPARTYLYGILIIIGVLLLAWYILSWINIRKSEKYLSSYLISTNTLIYEINNTNEIKQILKEAPNRYLVYISYNNDEEVYKLEKKLKRVIDEYELKDEFYYLNVTDSMNDKNFYNSLNNSFGIKNIKNVPCILFFENGEIKDIIQDKNDVFSYNDLIALLNAHEYEKEA